MNILLVPNPVIINKVQKLNINPTALELVNLDIIIKKIKSDIIPFKKLIIPIVSEEYPLNFVIKTFIKKVIISKLNKLIKIKKNIKTKKILFKVLFFN